MKKFERAYIPPEQILEMRAALAKTYPPAEVDKIMKDTLAEEIYLNDAYQVSVRSFYSELLDAGMVHLSIKRIDKEPVRDWRDLQEIKNQLVGRECEGVELFPAESRLVDTANQYHLWCFALPDYRFPIGWTTRLVSGEDALPDLPRVKQRPRE